MYTKPVATGPIGLLLSQHYGIAALGTTLCSYQTIHPHVKDLNTAILQHARHTADIPHGYRTFFPNDPTTLPVELQESACPDENDPRVTVELADFMQCCERVVLRKSNRHLIFEMQRGSPLPPPSGYTGSEPLAPSGHGAQRVGCPRRAAIQNDTAASAPAFCRAGTMVLTYEQIKELGREPSSWEVAPDRRRPAIGWTGAHDSVSEFPQTPPSKFHKGIAQPKITSFGTITDRQEQSQEPASSRAPKSTREWAPRQDKDGWRQNDWGR